MPCVHLEETDFHVLILWCEEEKKGCVGAKYEDCYTPLSAGVVCSEDFFGLLLFVLKCRRKKHPKGSCKTKK